MNRFDELRLEENPVFETAFDGIQAGSISSGRYSSLITWDGLGQLLIWDPSEGGLIHCVGVRRSQVVDDHGFEAPCLVTIPERGAPFQTLKLSPPIEFKVQLLEVNRSGRFLLLMGVASLAVVDLAHERGPVLSNGVHLRTCSTTLLGASGLFSASGEGPLRLLRVAWHPASDTHLGVLSSDAAFRLFDLSQDAERPEQELFLQRTKPPQAARVWPVDFAFGGCHLWERFTVFILWSDGAIFALCPVVPFRSRIPAAVVQDLHQDLSNWPLLHEAGAFSSPGADALRGSLPALGGDEGRAAVEVQAARAWLDGQFSAGVRQQGGGYTGRDRLRLGEAVYVEQDGMLGQRDAALLGADRTGGGTILGRDRTRGGSRGASGCVEARPGQAVGKRGRGVGGGAELEDGERTAVDRSSDGVLDRLGGARDRLEGGVVGSGGAREGQGLNGGVGRGLDGEGLVQGARDEVGGGGLVMTRAYVAEDRSLVLQGPLPVLKGSSTPRKPSHSTPAARLITSSAGRDTILSWAATDASMHIHVLGAEVSPRWSWRHPPPTVERDRDGRLVRVAGVAADGGGGELPPLVQLSAVDLGLVGEVRAAAAPDPVVDPLVAERIFCQHSGGVDAITLRWLPFTNEPLIDSEFDDPATIPGPQIDCLLDVRPTGGNPPAPLLGLAVLPDSVGDTWVVAVTSSATCTTVRVPSPASSLGPEPVVSAEEGEGAATDVDGGFGSICSQLSRGPKKLSIPRTASASLNLSTHEGQVVLHERWKLLHEKYILYAHSAHLQLTTILGRLEEKAAQQEQQATRIEEVLQDYGQQAASLQERVARVVASLANLAARLRRYSQLAGARLRPLTNAERDYVDDLRERQGELPELEATVTELGDRAARLLLRAEVSSANARGAMSPSLPDQQMRRLKVAVEQSTEFLGELLSKVQLADKEVSYKEKMCDR